METIQYFTLTHTSKDEALAHKKQADGRRVGPCRFSTQEMDFDEIVELHGRGMTIRRLPVMDKGPAAGRMLTSFLILDIDNKPSKDNKIPEPNITEDELMEMLWFSGLDGKFTISTSGLPYKYHLFIRVNEQVTSKNRYDALVDDAENRLEAAFRDIRGTMCPLLRDPKLTANSILYAPCTESVEPIGPVRIRYNGGPDKRKFYGYYADIPPTHLELTKDYPEPRYSLPTDNAVMADRTVPPRWSSLARMLRLEGLIVLEKLDNPGADFNLAGAMRFLRKGKTKESEKLQLGERDNMCSWAMLAVYGQARSYNLWMDQHGLGEHKFSLEDMKRTLNTILSNSYVQFDSFTHEKFLRQLEERYQRFEHMSDSEYVDTYKISESKREVAKTRMYVVTTVESIISSRTSDGKVVFQSTDERDEVLKDADVSLSTLRNMAKAKGLSIEIANSGKRGRKAGVSWESLSVIGKIYEEGENRVFRYTGKLCSAQKMFLMRNGVKTEKLKEKHGATSVAGGVQ